MIVGAVGRVSSLAPTRLGALWTTGVSLSVSQCLCRVNSLPPKLYPRKPRSFCLLGRGPMPPAIPSDSTASAHIPAYTGWLTHHLRLQPYWNMPNLVHPLTCRPASQAYAPPGLQRLQEGPSLTTCRSHAIPEACKRAFSTARRLQLCPAHLMAANATPAAYLLRSSMRNPHHHPALS